MKRPNSLPNSLTLDEIRKILYSRTDLKHRAIILTIYSCVLRIFEVVNLKTNDIDSSAMKVKIDKKMFSMITTK
jgi:integrase